MSGLRRDVRDAWRGLWHDRPLSMAAVVMMALAIAASSAIFAVVQAVVLRMPFDEPDRIVTIHARSADNEVVSISWEQFERWRQTSDVLESMAAYTLVSPVLTGD